MKISQTEYLLYGNQMCASTWFLLSFSSLCAQLAFTFCLSNRSHELYHLWHKTTLQETPGNKDSRICFWWLLHLWRFPSKGYGILVKWSLNREPILQWKAVISCKCRSQPWWIMPLILVSGRLKQKNWSKFKSTLGYINENLSPHNKTKT